ncbi:hypothetical protein FSARC_2950 [Fusarium sarcochroum]|uniref:Aminoglycoside phosphotransferase domain-containing protein n=1 Tax=Fusarium sarcochroum TaxID=1208366 RepID=A0A8H4U5J9_9HYPO|nr:hypothetical protein FSARC_2950 [Fusarium sarcochroum]
MASLAIDYDALFYIEGSDIYRDWDNNFTAEHMRDLELFIADRISDRGPSKFVTNELAVGSYNRVLRFSFESCGNDVALKFPKPGHTAASLAQEKITNEATWMQFLKENTALPIPHVYDYSTDVDSGPLKLPYILMDWVSGDNLRDFLAGKPPDDLRSGIYRQMAFYYIELYRLRFERIGSITKDETTGKWAVTKRPLTQDMHQFAIGIHDFPTKAWPTGPLQSNKSYFDFVNSQHTVQLWHLRNINASDAEQDGDGELTAAERLKKSSETARRRYVARHGIRQLTDHFCATDDDAETFRAFNPDLDPRNLLVDPETGDITGLIDFEFTNSMPSQFARDPPLWLLVILPENCLDKGFFPWFLQQYRPVLDQFLDAMRVVEQQLGYLPGETRLSTHMLDSWKTDRVWFNYAMTHTEHVDSIYWDVLHKHHPAGVIPELPDLLQMDMEKYVEHTKNQLDKYENAWTKYIALQRA